MGFYRHFLDSIIPPRPTELLLRNLEQDALIPYLRPRSIYMSAGHASLTTTALTSYAEPYIRAAVLETKFHGNKRATRILGTLTSSYLQRLRRDYLILIPVPLSGKRRKERGYNQVERIATEAARGMPGRCTVRTDVLFRTCDTTPQTSLGRRDRLKNLTDAFEVREPIVPHHTYIVLDDVTTTGATLSEATTALRRAGALHIVPLAVAFQPIGNEP